MDRDELYALRAKDFARRWENHRRVEWQGNLVPYLGDAAIADSFLHLGNGPFCSGWLEGGAGGVGGVNFPARGERSGAAGGGGARMNGAPCHVARADRVPRSFVVFAGMGDWLSGPHAAGVQRLVSDARRDRGFGDAWGHCLVARGSADVMLELELSTWDFAALQVIVQEAGGRITQFDGAPLVHGGTGLTTNGSLHQEIVARLKPKAD